MSSYVWYLQGLITSFTSPAESKWLLYLLGTSTLSFNSVRSWLQIVMYPRASSIHHIKTSCCLLCMIPFSHIACATCLARNVVKKFTKMRAGDPWKENCKYAEFVTDILEIYIPQNLYEYKIKLQWYIISGACMSIHNF